MLRITTRDSSDGIAIVVEGELTRIGLDELRRCWQAARARSASPRIVVDITSMTGCDSTGKALLAQLYGEGAGLVGAGVMTRALIDQITGA
jgi:ABC-type transporter Mla MlaB component